MKRIASYVLLLIGLVTSCTWLNRDKPPIHLATVEYVFDGHTFVVPIYKQYKYTKWPYGESYGDDYYPTAKYEFKTSFQQLGWSSAIVNDSLARFIIEVFSADELENHGSETEWVAFGFMLKNDTSFFKEGMRYNLEPCDTSDSFLIPDVDDYFICPECLILDEGASSRGIVSADRAKYWVAGHSNLPKYELIRKQSWCSFFVPVGSRKLTVKFEFKGKSISEPADTVVVSGIMDLYSESPGEMLVQ